MTSKANGARFGSPDSIDPGRLFRLPVAMQSEGLRLLIEMGQSLREVMARTGLGAGEVEHLLNGRHQPFMRPGDSNQIGKGNEE